MKKPIATTFPIMFPVLAKTVRLKAYGFIAIVFLAGCTATVVRWNSGKMREEIIAYYNDEIMDNLIRMKEGLPFVHVDISSVSAQGISQVSGTVGGGETESFTRTSPSMIGALHTISTVATAPFTYSVTPLHDDTLTMTAVPVIGQLPIDSSEATPTTSSSNPTSTPTPKTTTIYSIYERLGTVIAKNPNVLVCSDSRPSETAYVPGTLKRHGLKFYYIREDEQRKNRALYYKLCKGLFTQSRGKTSGKTLKAEVETLKAQGVVPPTPR
jgi:hypothetical protein